MIKARKSVINIVAHDLGERTKTHRFQGDNKGRLWFHPDNATTTKKVTTPFNVAPKNFMDELREALKAKNQWYGEPDFRVFSVCGPMAQGDQCLRLVNRGVLEPFTVPGYLALNDGLAGLLGSIVGGVAKGHMGAIRIFVLGSGLGTADRHWALDDQFREYLVYGDMEAHFTVHGCDNVCGCNLEGCAEAGVRESALGDLIVKHGVALEQLKNPDKEKLNIGRDLEFRIAQPGCTFKPQLFDALNEWQNRLAVVVSNVLGGTTIGGDKLRKPGLIVIGGGLGRFVKPKIVYDRVLALSKGIPQNGANFEVRVEDKLGNTANCVGVAAAGLAKFLGIKIDEIEFLNSPPLNSGKK
jgi:hypothetical protein